jgi:hypothetical protein
MLSVPVIEGSLLRVAEDLVGLLDEHKVGGTFLLLAGILVRMPAQSQLLECLFDVIFCRIPFHLQQIVVTSLLNNETSINQRKLPIQICSDLWLGILTGAFSLVAREEGLCFLVKLIPNTHPKVLPILVNKKSRNSMPII